MKHCFLNVSIKLFDGQDVSSFTIRFEFYDVLFCFSSLPHSKSHRPERLPEKMILFTDQLFLSPGGNRPFRSDIRSSVDGSSVHHRYVT
jgi:hypothetical protein